MEIKLFSGGCGCRGIPYDLKMDNENNFHNAFYILVTLIGLDAKAEAHTSDGRKIFKTGVSFSSETRLIEAWKIQ